MSLPFPAPDMQELAAEFRGYRACHLVSAAVVAAIERLVCLRPGVAMAFAASHFLFHLLRASFIFPLVSCRSRVKTWNRRQANEGRAIATPQRFGLLSMETRLTSFPMNAWPCRHTRSRRLESSFKLVQACWHVYTASALCPPIPCSAGTHPSQAFTP